MESERTTSTRVSPKGRIGEEGDKTAACTRARERRAAMGQEEEPQTSSCNA